MTLNAWSAETKRSIFDDLSTGKSPRCGSFDNDLLLECQSLGRPQVGPTAYSPESVTFEFVYGNPTTTRVLTVRVEPPERIVFMPVPSWVVETIWQGDVDGSYHFASQAAELLDTFARSLEPVPNALLFGPKAATRRE